MLSHPSRPWQVPCVTALRLRTPVLRHWLAIDLVRTHRRSPLTHGEPRVRVSDLVGRVLHRHTGRNDQRCQRSQASVWSVAIQIGVFDKPDEISAGCRRFNRPRTAHSLTPPSRRPQRSRTGRSGHPTTNVSWCSGEEVWSHCSPVSLIHTKYAKLAEVANDGSWPSCWFRCCGADGGRIGEHKQSTS